ncbi:MAG: SPOR domain-containing protein [Bacteroidaceae bacterium]|nr:SPOR domain-containing protein [Bacteroidaceae bacterium]
MLRIISHIENLLLSHDCVIVPGIGGFVTHFEEAFFSEDGSEIFPPYCSVSFNAHLSDKEDKYGMLTQSYMTAYDINYPKALALVNDDVAEMRDTLRKNMELQIGTIGTLQLTLNYSLLFTPSEECGLFAKELYGLVQSEINNSRIGATTNPGIEVAEPVTTNSQQVNEPRSSMRIIERDKDNTHYIIRVSKNAVRYTVTTIAAALLYFVFTIAPNVEPVIGSGVQQAGIVTNTKTHQLANSSTRHHAKAQSNQALKSQNHDIAATPKEALGEYTLVLASKVSEKGARRLADELKESGFAEAQVIDDDGMTRVIYSSYPTDDEAYRAAKTLRSQHKGFRSAWVMKK